MNESEKYSDIIGMPRHVSGSRRHMPTSDRAKIFAPFAALRGLDDAVRAKARAADSRVETADDKDEEIDLALRRLSDMLRGKEKESAPTVSVTYFDGSAGAYVVLTARISSVCAVTRTVTLGGVMVGFDDIRDIIIRGCADHASGETPSAL